MLIRDRLIDDAYIRDRTEGFEEARRIAAAYWPERVERITGVAEADVVAAAERLGQAPRDDSHGARSRAAGAGRQQHAGVHQPRAGARQGRQAVQRLRHAHRDRATARAAASTARKPISCPAIRRIDDPAARQHVAADVWGVPPRRSPGPGKSAYELLDSMGADGGVRALLVMGSNIVVSAPDATEIERKRG